MPVKKIVTRFFIIAAWFVIASCGNSSDVKEGEALAKTYCASCHQFPEPELLDKKTWSEGVLPQMAKLMNVDVLYDPFSNTSADTVIRIKPADLFPSEKWNKIEKYYLAAAPEKPLQRKAELPQVKPELKNFTVHFISAKFKNPLTTFVQIDTAAKKISFADGGEEKLFVYNADMKMTDSAIVPKGTVAINTEDNTQKILSMGVLTPSDEKLGRLWFSNNYKNKKIILDSLQRPVHIGYADLNNDGRQDMIVCEFGYHSGALSWFENIDGSHYAKHILRALPGAVSTEVYDFNKDGKPDIIALMAQADEGVFIYYNQGNGNFKEEKVLSFPPVYGSNYMQLTDFNEDGFIDILTTNGDNADYSLSLKAYHGIRIFLNDGKNNFTEKVFLPVNGIQKAIPFDFDSDGDIDIASIAFFPDYKNMPEESFIYWENKGNDVYERSTFATANDGRWLVMDAGDMDGDGDTDILLGSAAFTIGDVPAQYKNNWTDKKVSAAVLENMLITRK